MRRTNGTLEQAMVMLMQNQAASIAHFNNIYARLARIESELEQIKAILNELPEAIRQKTGFKSK